MSKTEKKRVVKLVGRSFALPGSRWQRLVLGVLLIVGGVLGFLPVVGFWMLPLGVLVLSIDLAPVRRFRRLFASVVGRWRQRWFSRKDR